MDLIGTIPSPGDPLQLGDLSDDEMLQVSSLHKKRPPGTPTPKRGFLLGRTIYTPEAVEQQAAKWSGLYNRMKAAGGSAETSPAPNPSEHAPVLDDA